jgi:hypothetical protein
MKTSAYPNYHEWAMKPSYVATSMSGKIGWGEPLDFAPLDAPLLIAAGSHECYEFNSIPGNFTCMYSAVTREA